MVAVMKAAAVLGGQCTAFCGLQAPQHCHRYGHSANNATQTSGGHLVKYALEIR